MKINSLVSQFAFKSRQAILLVPILVPMFSAPALANVTATSSEPTLASHSTIAHHHRSSRSIERRRVRRVFIDSFDRTYFIDRFGRKVYFTHHRYSFRKDRRIFIDSKDRRYFYDRFGKRVYF